MSVPGCEVYAWRKLRSHCPRPRDKLSCPSTQSRESEDGLRVGGDSKGYYLAFQRIPNSDCVWYFRKTTHLAKLVHTECIRAPWRRNGQPYILNPAWDSDFGLWVPGTPDSGTRTVWWYRVSYDGTKFPTMVTKCPMMVQRVMRSYQCLSHLHSNLNGIVGVSQSPDHTSIYTCSNSQRGIVYGQ